MVGDNHGDRVWNYACDAVKRLGNAQSGHRSGPKDLKCSVFRKIGRSSTGDRDQVAREMEGNRGIKSHSQVRTQEERTTS